jgi:hypothetical protein
VERACQDAVLGGWAWTSLRNPQAGQNAGIWPSALIQARSIDIMSFINMNMFDSLGKLLIM